MTNRAVSFFWLSLCYSCSSEFAVQKYDVILDT